MIDVVEVGLCAVSQAGGQGLVAGASSGLGLAELEIGEASALLGIAGTLIVGGVDGEQTDRGGFEQRSAGQPVLGGS